MKALPKKRTHQINQNLNLKLHQTSSIRPKILWYSASIVSYGWFLSWIAYDIFVWQKPLAQVSVVNYVGAIASMALVWAGTKLWKNPKRTQEPSRKQENQEPPRTQKQNKPTNHKQQPKNPEPQPATTIPTPITCKRHNGLPKQHPTTKHIPEQCLTCQNLIQCTTTTKQENWAEPD